MGEAVQFFHQIDLTDPKSVFSERSLSGGPTVLQSHGWLDGVLAHGSLEEAAAAYDPKKRATWPMVVPARDVVLVDRFDRKVIVEPFLVPMHRLRKPSSTPPQLSMLFIRWGGKKRVGESSETEQLEDDGGWGHFGCPPSDWYMDAVVAKGAMCHPVVGENASYDVEILSLFLGSKRNVLDIAPSAQAIYESMRGVKKSSWWMLWPADFEADWKNEGYAGYVERRSLFAAMRACEDAGIRSTFPHPAVLYEYITSKAWMATLCEDQRSRLPAATLVPRADIVENSRAAAERALKDLVARRETSVFAPDGPSQVNRKSKPFVERGAVKIGWSWEAKYMWFWNGPDELARCLYEMLNLPGCLTDHCIVQEWVDFDFELRLFFLPPSDWRPPASLEPQNFEYTCWGSGSTSPGSFNKLSGKGVLDRWSQDQAAVDKAHAEAIEVSQFLVARLLEQDTTTNEPVPMIRLDFMLKRLGPGQVRVVFGEYCEMGACCLKWNDGPPRIWRAALDYALR